MGGRAQRDRFFHEPMSPDDVVLMHEDYAEWATRLLRSHGVCQLFMVTAWPYSDRDLTSSWRVPQGYTHVALSDRLAIGADAFNGILEQVEGADQTRKMLVDAGVEPKPYAPSRVRSIAAETRKAAESKLTHAWVGLGDGVIVPIEGAICELSSLGECPPRTLEVSVDGWVRLGSDTTESYEYERERCATTRCWIRGDPSDALEVTTVCPAWGDRYVEKTGTFAQEEWSEQSLRRIASRVLGVGEREAFQVLCLLYGGSPDPRCEDFPRARLAELVIRVRGRVVRYHEDLATAEDEFWKSHPKAGWRTKERDGRCACPRKC